MGLADISSVAIMTTMNRSTTSATSAPVPGSQVRKKRTFDIAFLTGQEDREERNVSSSSLISERLSPIERHRHHHRPTPPAIIDESTSNSTSSSIDVMTNGSLSESELNLSPSHAPTITPSPTEVAAITCSSLSSSTSLGGSPPRTLHRGRVVESPVKSRKNNHREEIRFESKRTIDINQTNDSVKIKENLQFSSTLPTSLPTPVVPGAVELVKSLPFALLPQIANFPPGVHLPSPFAHSKMDKSEGLNIMYPGLGTGGNPTKISRHSPGSSFVDPYNLPIPHAGYPYPQNLMLPHDLNRLPNYPNPRHPIATSQAVAVAAAAHHGPTSSPQITSAAAAAAVAAAATLLPPSLTALTLPAQNVCAKCNIGFRMTSDLVYHMRSHHKRDSDPLKKKREEKLKCPVCHESFRERHHLTRHMTAHQDRAEEAEAQDKNTLIKPLH